MRDITLQTVIPWRRQILGSIERGHRYFRDISQQIPDEEKNKQVGTVDRKEYAPICMIILSSEVRKYDCFAPGRRVFGMPPKLPIRTASGPHFREFTTLSDSPLTQTRDAIALFRETQKASLEQDSQCGFNLALRSSSQELQNRRMLVTPNCLFLSIGRRK